MDIRIGEIVYYDPKNLSSLDMTKYFRVDFSVK